MKTQLNGGFRSVVAGARMNRHRAGILGNDCLQQRLSFVEGQRNRFAGTTQRSQAIRARVE